MRYLLAVVTLAGCHSDAPTLTFGLTSSTLSISLERDSDHAFGTLHAAVNGIDCGSATISPGSEGITWSEASSPASASWQIDLAQVGSSAHVVVTEDGDAFSADVAELAAARAVHLDTSLATPITPGSTIEADDGVPSDTVSGGFEIDGSDGSPCTVQWGTKLLPGAVALGVDTNLAADWWCGDSPEPGTRVDATLALELWAAVPVTSCRGDDLTCDDIALPDQQLATPIAIQF